MSDIGINKPRQRGFTLLELMIACVIVGIIAAVAYPAYTDYIDRTNRSNAIAVMEAVSGALEVYSLNPVSGATGYTGSTDGSDNPLPSVINLTSSRYPIVDTYDIKVVSVATNSFTIKATPKAGGPMSGDGPMILFSDGRKGWDKDSNGTYEALEL